MYLEVKNKQIIEASINEINDITKHAYIVIQECSEEAIRESRKKLIKFHKKMRSIKIFNEIVLEANKIEMEINSIMKEIELLRDSTCNEFNKQMDKVKDDLSTHTDRMIAFTVVTLSDSKKSKKSILSTVDTIIDAIECSVAFITDKDNVESEKITNKLDTYLKLSKKRTSEAVKRVTGVMKK